MEDSGIKGTCSVENVTPFGVWILVNGKEYLLDFEHFPWFVDARIAQIQNVELHHGFHLHWPALDVDLELESLENPERYPLLYR